MRRYFPILVILFAFAGLVGCPPTPRVDTLTKDKNAKNDDKKPPIEVPKDLQKRVELALAQVQGRDLMTTNAFWTIFHGILGSGLDNTMLTDPVTRKKVNAIEHICKGKTVRGLQFLPDEHGLDVYTAKPGDQEGVAQGHQDQFIAEMAQWGMKREHKFKVGGKDYTFEDFTNFSMMRASTKKNQELSWAIIIIAQFYGTDYKWTNRDGDELTFDDVVRFEVDAPIDQAACGGTHRLFGLTWAYHLHLKNGGKKTGVWEDVDRKLTDYRRAAFKLQNPDGTFSTDYFKGTGNVDNAEHRIRTTGHVVEWLALAMSDEELKSEPMQRAVSSLSRLILDASGDAIDSGALYHAAHGLHLYHVRVFGTPEPFLALPPRR